LGEFGFNQKITNSRLRVACDKGRPAIQQQSSTRMTSLEVLLHTIFFTNLLVIMLQSTANNNISRRQWPIRIAQPGEHQRFVCCRHSSSLGHSASSITTASTPVPFWVKVLRMASPSLWAALIWSYLEGPPPSSEALETKYFQFAASLFGIGCLVLMVGKLYQDVVQRRRGADEQSAFIPVVSTSTTASPSVLEEEHRWYSWTVAEVVQWLSETPSSLSDHESLNQILPRLAWERVDGSTLEHLDQEALRNMGIRYGPACQLLEQIQNRLIRRYPRRSQQNKVINNNSHEQPQQELDSFLSHYDQEYQLPFSQRQQAQQQNLKSWRHNELSMDAEEVDGLREKMTQRWGLQAGELPAKLNEAKPELESNTLHTSDAKLPPADLSNQVEGVDIGTLSDDQLLETMPPHIRDIIERKPHLWQQVKAIHREQQMDDQAEQDQEQHRNKQSTPAIRSQKLQAQTQYQPQPVSLVEPPVQNTAAIELPLAVAPEVLQALPPHIREVATRNPELFLQMLNSNQQQQQQQQSSAMASIPEESFDDKEDEFTQLIPKSHINSSKLRQRPGF
jgi:hypothetical protein